MTMDIHTEDQPPEDPVPALHTETLKDLAPRDDDQIVGGYANGTSGGGGCISD